MEPGKKKPGEIALGYVVPQAAHAHPLICFSRHFQYAVLTAPLSHRNSNLHNILYFQSNPVWLEQLYFSRGHLSRWHACVHTWGLHYLCSPAEGGAVERSPRVPGASERGRRDDRSVKCRRAKYSLFFFSGYLGWWNFRWRSGGWTLLKYALHLLDVLLGKVVCNCRSHDRMIIFIWFTPLTDLCACTDTSHSFPPSSAESSKGLMGAISARLLRLLMMPDASLPRLNSRIIIKKKIYFTHPLRGSGPPFSLCASSYFKTTQMFYYPGKKNSKVVFVLFSRAQTHPKWAN